MRMWKGGDMTECEAAQAASDLEGFRLGFELCAAGREWDAHEVWEELWKARRGTPDGALLRGLIQWAAAGVKLKAERPSGALSLVDKALATWSELPDRMVFDGRLGGAGASAVGSRAEGGARAEGPVESEGGARSEGPVEHAGSGGAGEAFDVAAARRALLEWRAFEGARPLPLPTLESA